VGGRGWYRSKERWWVYRPSIVTFRPSFRVSEILSLLCCSTPLFPTPPLVSRKFSHVPLGAGGWLSWATKSEGVGLSVRAISFQDFQLRPICDPDTPTVTNVTDGRTNGQTNGWLAIARLRFAVLPRRALRMHSRTVSKLVKIKESYA